MTSAKMKQSSFVVVCFAHFLMVSLAAGNNTTLSTGMELPEPTPTGLLSTGLTTTNATATLPVSSTGTTAGDPESSSSSGEEVTRMTESSISRLVMSISYTITKSKAVSTSSTTAGGHGDGIATMAPTMVTFSTAAKPSSFSDTTYFSTSSDITTIIGVESETPVISLSLPSATLSPSLSTAFKDQNRRSSGTPSPTRMTTTTVALITTPKPTTSSMAIGDSTSVVAPSMMSVPMSTSTSFATSDVGTTSTSLRTNTESIPIPASSPGVAVSPSSSPAAEGDSVHSSRSLPLIIGSVYSIMVLVVTNIMQLAFCCSSKSDGKVYIFLHINIVASLMCGSIFLLAGTAESAWKVTMTCKAISGLTTYFLLVPFAWFLAEAIFMNFHIRGLTTSTYQVMLMLLIFCFCWILPVLVTGVVADESAITTGEDRMLQQCWLSNDGGSVAAFLVPLALLSLLTVVLCCLLGYALHYQIENQKHQQLRHIRCALLSVVILLPLMVLTWVIASLHVSYGNTALGWIYLVLVLITDFVIFDLYGIIKLARCLSMHMNNGKNNQPHGDNEVEMAALSARPAACLNESNHGTGRCNTENVATVEDTYATPPSCQSQLSPARYFHPKPPSLKIREEICRGAYGSVHFGELNERPVAVKRIHRLLLEAAREQGDFEQVMTDFKRECQLLETLHHPHMVDFRGAFYDETTEEPVLVMERMRENLREYLKKNEAEGLSRQQQLEICLGMVRGLRFLHTHNPPIVHRDLTDKNVMFGKDGLVKIGDLGQSRLKTNNAEYFSTAQPGAIPFMPPEAMRKESRYNEKLDIFSLGVLMLEVATQQPPTVELYGIGVTPEIQRHATDLSKLDADHPLKLLILSCLNDDQRQRPDIVTVHTQLQAIVEGVEGKNMAHCDLGNFLAPYGESSRLLTLKTLLFDKKEMLDTKERELAVFEEGHQYRDLEENSVLKAQQLGREMVKLEKLCKFLQECLDEEMIQSSLKNGCAGDSEVEKPLEQEVWYRDDIPDIDAKRILWSCPVGAFIVRKSRSDSLGSYALVVRNETQIDKFKILHVRGLYRISDMLQFASVQDLVQFFTRYWFEIGVKLRPMNVTDHYNKCKKQIQKGNPAVHSVQPQTMEEALAAIEDLTRQLEQSQAQALDCTF